MSGVLLLASSYAHAWQPDPFAMRGFITLGLTSSDDSVLGFRQTLEQSGTFDSDWTFKTNSAAGIHLDIYDYKPVSAVLQFTVKHLPTYDLDSITERAYVRYRPNRRTMLRAGRVDDDLYMLSDHQHVAFAYPWMRAPVESYGIIPMQHLDGVDAEITWDFDSGKLKTKLLLGSSESDIYRSAEAINRRRRQNREEFDRPSGEGERPNRVRQENLSASGSRSEIGVKDLVGLNMTWETDTWRVRYMILNSKFDENSQDARQLDSLLTLLEDVSDVWPGALGFVESIDIEDDQFVYQSLGLQIDTPRWFTRLELNHLDSDNGVKRSFLAGYWSWGLKHKNLTYYFVLGAIDNTDSSEKVLESLDEIEDLDELVENQLLTDIAEEIEDLLDKNSVEQHSITLGARIDLRHDLAIKIQWDHAVVKEDGAKLWEQRGKMDTDRDINTYAVAINYVF